MNNLYETTRIDLFAFPVVTSGAFLALELGSISINPVNDLAQ